MTRSTGSARDLCPAPCGADDRRLGRRCGCGGEEGVERGQLPLPIGPDPTAPLPAGCEWIAVRVAPADEVRDDARRRLTTPVDTPPGQRCQCVAEVVAVLAAPGLEW